MRLFARAAELAGAAQVEVRLAHPATVQRLREALARQIPALAPLQSTLLIAVNQRYARPETVIDAGAEVACFPPVSGG